MMKNNLKHFLNTISQINESIYNLLSEDGIIELPSGSNAKKEIFIVIEDGKTFPNDGKNYINLKDAKVYKSDVKVGDEIELETIDYEEMEEENLIKTLEEQLLDGKLNQKDLEQIAIVAGSSKFRRTAVGIIRVGNKLQTAAKTVMLLKRYEKKIPHSDCYCARLFEDNLDETVTPPVPSKDIYLSSVSGYMDVVQDQFEETWDECEKEYPEIKKDNDKRNELLSTCTTIEDWYTDAKAVLDNIISDLQKYFKITNIDIKKKKLQGDAEDDSIAKQIGMHATITLHFEEDFKDKAGTTIYRSGRDETFDVGTYKETGSTVKLEKGGRKWYFQFQTAQTRKIQAGSVWPDNGHNAPDSSLSTSWKGYIVKYD
jgi:hypothetical protein